MADAVENPVAGAATTADEEAGAAWGMSPKEMQRARAASQPGAAGSTEDTAVAAAKAEFRICGIRMNKANGIKFT